MPVYDHMKDYQFFIMSNLGWSLSGSLGYGAGGQKCKHTLLWHQHHSTHGAINYSHDHTHPTHTHTHTHSPHVILG